MSGTIAAIERLYRRVLMVVGRGRIKTGRDDGPAQLLQVRLGQLETVDNLPRLAEYGFNSMPPEDVDAIVLFAGGNRSDGVIIATSSQTYRMRSLHSGEVSISDDQGQSVYLMRGGIKLTDKAGSTVTLNGDGSGDMTFASGLTIHANSKIVGTLEVTQDITSDASITAAQDVADQGGAKTMAGMREVFNNHDHLVANVQGGTGSVTSNKPGQQE
jgi:phage gp45-like